MCATLYWVLLTVSFGTRPIVSITLTCDKTITFSGVSKRAKTTTSNSCVCVCLVLLHTHFCI